MKTAVLVPCFNEEATIAKVVADFLAADPSVVVYVCDNNCTDDTARRARASGAIVVREARQGKGWAIRTLFREVDADCYIIVDGDDTYPAEGALALRAPILDGTADMVIGDRMSSTYRQENRRRFHTFGNRLVRFLVNRLFDSQLHDIMSGCRCLTRRFVKTMPIMSPGFEIETEITIHALDKHFRVQETPLQYRDRGPASESKLDTFSDGAKVVATIAKLFRDYRPLPFFGTVGGLLLTASLLSFSVPLREYLATGLVSKFPTLIVSMALGVSSLLSFFCGILLNSISNHSRQFYELAVNAYTDFRHETSGGVLLEAQPDVDRPPLTALDDAGRSSTRHRQQESGPR